MIHKIPSHKKLSNLVGGWHHEADISYSIIFMDSLISLLLKIFSFVILLYSFVNELHQSDIFVYIFLLILLKIEDHKLRLSQESIIFLILPKDTIQLNSIQCFKLHMYILACAFYYAVSTTFHRLNSLLRE